MTIIIIHRDINLQAQINNVLACVNVKYTNVLSKITCSQNINFDIYLSSSLYVFLNHSSVGLPSSSINFCYKHIYNEISKKVASVMGSNVNVRLDVILVLPNMTMKLSNVRKKMRTTKCDKSIAKCDVGTVECDYGTIKCEKKNKGTTKYDKRTVTCDVGTAQCEDETIKCKKKKMNY